MPLRGHGPGSHFSLSLFGSCSGPPLKNVTAVGGRRLESRLWVANPRIGIPHASGEKDGPCSSGLQGDRGARTQLSPVRAPALFLYGLSFTTLRSTRHLTTAPPSPSSLCLAPVHLPPVPGRGRAEQPPETRGGLRAERTGVLGADSTSCGVLGGLGPFPTALESGVGSSSRPEGHVLPSVVFTPILERTKFRAWPLALARPGRGVGPVRGTGPSSRGEPEGS